MTPCRFQVYDVKRRKSVASVKTLAEARKVAKKSLRLLEIKKVCGKKHSTVETYSARMQGTTKVLQAKDLRKKLAG